MWRQDTQVGFVTRFRVIGILLQECNHQSCILHILWIRKVLIVHLQLQSAAEQDPQEASTWLSLVKTRF